MKEKGVLESFELEAEEIEDVKKKAKHLIKMEKKKTELVKLEAQEAYEITRLANRARWNVKEKKQFLPLVETYLREHCADEVRVLTCNLMYVVMKGVYLEDDAFD